jgi:hypothetical protein
MSHHGHGSSSRRLRSLSKNPLPSRTNARGT